jgi:putative membrane protein
VKAQLKLRVTACVLGFAGAALLTGLILREGVGQVGAAVAGAGWGLLFVLMLHLMRVVADTSGWLLLIPKQNRLPLHTGFWMHWLGESVSDLLPAARIGGDILTARLAATKGMPLTIATASMLVDVTACVFMKIFFTVTGLLLLVVATGTTNIVGPALAGVLVGILAIGGFYGVQRLGIFRWGALFASRLGNSPGWLSLAKGGAELDATVQTLYARRGAVAGCCFWSVISWLIGSGEVWIALHALGVPANFATAVILETVVQGIRGAMFLVPGALGVQEGGYLVVGGLLGLPGTTALALSLIRRARELTLGVPGLIVWQFIEGHRLWRKRLIQKDQDSPSPHRSQILRDL